MHSGLLIFYWLAAVAALQFVTPLWLYAATTLCAIVAVCYAPRRCLRLLRRIRFLVLAIVVLFAGFTPGEALLLDWPNLSPSREGVALAVEHVGRILAVVFCVAILMEHLPPHRLVSAIHALLRPLEVLNVPAARIAVRTLMVLKLVEGDAPKGWKAWLNDDHDDRHDPISIVREPFGTREGIVVGVTLLAVVFGWWLA